MKTTKPYKITETPQGFWFTDEETDWMFGCVKKPSRLYRTPEWIAEAAQKARLLAAAPMLLAACIEICAWANCECGEGVEGLYEKGECAVCLASAAIDAVDGVKDRAERGA